MKTTHYTGNRGCTFLIVTTLLFMSSCVSTERFTSFAQEKLVKLNPVSQPSPPDYLEIKTDSLLARDSLVKVQKVKSFFIPAILYWHSEHTLKCDLGSTLPAKIFRQDMIRFADSVNLKSKLKGQTLELSLVYAPHHFIYSHREIAVIFIVAYAVHATEVIYPDIKGLNVTYRLLENGVTIKNGMIEVPHLQQPVKKKKTNSTKLFTWDYMDAYRQACSGMNKQLFNKLLEVL